MTKTERIIALLSEEITSGHWPAGHKLPSLRRAAEEFCASKNTIVEAYDRLASRGLVQPTPGSGFYVSGRESATIGHKPQPPHMAQAIDRISLLNDQLSRDLPLRPGDGQPPPSWMSEAMRSNLTGKFFRNLEGDHTSYGSAAGHAPLREILAMHSLRKGLSVTPDQIVTTFGANHALDLIIRRFLEPGDCVLVDEPGYYPLLAKLKLAQLRVIGVPRRSDGPDIEAMRRLTRAHAPRMFFTQSSCHNPTGSSMSLAVAHGILQIAAQNGILVVDDDPFLDLPSWPGRIMLAALDQFDIVLAISTFSKLLSASFRAGYVICKLKYARELAELKLVTTVNSSRFSEMVITELITGQRYQRHLSRLNGRLAEARSVYLTQIRRLGLETHCPDEAGYYSFLHLPPGVEEARMLDLAARRGIFLAPGSLFYPDEAPPRPSMRINVTRTGDPLFYRFLRECIETAGR